MLIVALGIAISVIHLQVLAWSSVPGENLIKVAQLALTVAAAVAGVVWVRRIWPRLTEVVASHEPVLRKLGEPGSEHAVRATAPGAHAAPALQRDWVEELQG